MQPCAKLPTENGNGDGDNMVGWGGDADGVAEAGCGRGQGYRDGVGTKNYFAGIG